MKKYQILMVLVILTIGLKLQGQPISIKTSSVSVTEKIDKNNWTKWSDFVKAEILITIDGKKNRIVVNSPEIQVFTIKSYGDKTETNTDKIIPFDCTDNNGSKCKIFVITRKKEANRMQFYINYSDVKFVYNIYN